MEKTCNEVNHLFCQTQIYLTYGREKTQTTAHYAYTAEWSLLLEETLLALQSCLHWLNSWLLVLRRKHRSTEFLWVLAHQAPRTAVTVKHLFKKKLHSELLQGDVWALDCFIRDKIISTVKNWNTLRWFLREKKKITNDKTPGGGGVKYTQK